MRAPLEVAPAASAQNLIGLLLEQVALKPTGIAASYKQDGQWKELTWAQVRGQLQELSAGLVALGVRPGDRVAVFGATTYHWALMDLAISAARAITVPIYSSNTPDECRYILN